MWVLRSPSWFPRLSRVPPRVACAPLCLTGGGGVHSRGGLGGLRRTMATPLSLGPSTPVCVWCPLHARNP